MKRIRFFLKIVPFVILCVACGAQESASPVAQGPTADLLSVNAVAERYVKLGLGLGEYDVDYVDGYLGPEDWTTAIADDPPSLEALASEADVLVEALDRIGEDTPRTRVLRKTIIAARTRIDMAMGHVLSFDDETRAIYDAVAPEYALEDFDRALEEIDALLPGEGTTAQRVDAFRSSLAIPADKLDAVFTAAIKECRKRTKERIELPSRERFSLAYVDDKPWSGYNWFQGDYESLIELNTDFPIVIDRAVDLGCHEGYPGHHTLNVLIESQFVEVNGWSEYLLFPLFSPMSLMFEGSANYGIVLAFPGDEKIAFERDVLFPLAGLDPAKAATLDALNQARKKLSHARNHVARSYLDGAVSRDEAVGLMVEYGLQSRERAEQSIAFVETYRGYIINYNLGLDLVERYMDALIADGVDPWDAFERLLTTPRSASEILAEIEN